MGRCTQVGIPTSHPYTLSITTTNASRNRSPDDRFAGNGGLSLRRVSAVRKILKFQQRYNDTEPEDEWFGRRITVLPGAKVAHGEEEDHFSVEDVWHEKPMGFHVRDGGENLAEDVWRDPERRKGNFEYCPELAMIMPMKLERERCEGDNGEGEVVGGEEIEKQKAEVEEKQREMDYEREREEEKALKQLEERGMEMEMEMEMGR